MPASSEIPCPHCGSTKNIKKYTRNNTCIPPTRVRQCKSCGRRFSETRRKTRESPLDTARKYLSEFKSLDAAAKNLGIPKTTLHRRIIEEANKTPDWYELNLSIKAKYPWGSVMGIDTSGLKIKRGKYVYLHISDMLSHDPVAYLPCEKEDCATVEPVLRQLKAQGFDPRIVVTDLAPELLEAVRKVHPHAIIQGCLFHLIQSLDRALPTRYFCKRIDRSKIPFYSEVKKLIFHAAISKNKDVRHQILDELQQKTLSDDKAREVFLRFLENLKYYHTMDEEEFRGLGPNILYNNMCERHIGMIKDLLRDMKGFKNMESARKFIKLYWFYKRKELISHPKNEKNLSLTQKPERKEVSTCHVPLECYFFDIEDLSSLSAVSGTPRRILEKAAAENGCIVIGNCAFTQVKLNEVQRRISMMVGKPVEEVSKEISCDKLTTQELVLKCGFKIQWNSFFTLGTVQLIDKHDNEQTQSQGKIEVAEAQNRKKVAKRTHKARFDKRQSSLKAFWLRTQ